MRRLVRLAPESVGKSGLDPCLFGFRRESGVNGRSGHGGWDWARL